MSGLKKNFFYSSILTTSSYVFQILSYPYVTRVLGVQNIGLCNFIDSIINYFILLSMMGVSVTGIREISKARNDKNLSEIFSSVFWLNAIFTFIALICLLCYIFFVNKAKANFELYIIGSFKLIFNFLLIEWFFRGIEDFKYITIRSIITRGGFVLAIYLLVKQSEDYRIYYGLLCGMTVLNAIINIVYSRNFVRLTFHNISFKPLIKPFIILGFNGFLISMYTTLNITYLGFVSNDTEVGYYTTATKLYAIILALYTAFTGVMLPRMSSLISKSASEEFKNLLNKSIYLLLSCSIPIIIFFEFFSPQIVYLLAGEGFEGAIVPMRIVMPLVFIIGYEQVLIIQTLMPIRKDKVIFLNSIIGALIGLILNILLVPIYFAVGSSIVWICSELTIMILSQIAVKKYIGVSFPFKTILKILLNYIPVILIFIAIIHINNSIGSTIMCGILISIYFFVLHRIILNDELGKLIKKFI